MSSISKNYCPNSAARQASLYLDFGIDSFMSHCFAIAHNTPFTLLAPDQSKLTTFKASNTNTRLARVRRTHLMSYLLTSLGLPGTPSSHWNSDRLVRENRLVDAGGFRTTAWKGAEVVLRQQTCQDHFYFGASKLTAGTAHPPVPEEHVLQTCGRPLQRSSVLVRLTAQFRKAKAIEDMGISVDLGVHRSSLCRKADIGVGRDHEIPTYQVFPNIPGESNCTSSVSVMES